MLKVEDFERSLDGLKKAVVAARSHSSAMPVALVTDKGHVDETAVAFNVFAKLLASDGIRSALYSVLRRSNYRYLSIFRFKDGKATSCVHVDREDLTATQAAEVPETATYCSYARAAKTPFVTANASEDTRTIGHVAREVVLAYCGIPVLESDGTFIGTLCHYDLVPRNPEELDLELLLQVSSALATSGSIPPYPESPAVQA